MIYQLSYNDRQEWIIRVGCLFIVVGIHLWLLLFKQDQFFISGENTPASAGSLTLSFSASQTTTKSDSVEPVKSIDSVQKELSQLSDINKHSPQTVSKTVTAKTHAADANIKQRSQYENKVVSENMAEQPSQTITDKPSIKPEEIVNENQADSAANKAIVYKPELSEPPVPPAYPNKARRKKQQGTVWLDILLDERGEQKLLAIHKSSGFAILDKAAVRAVSQWRFAKFQGRYSASDVTIRIPIEFLLN